MLAVLGRNGVGKSTQMRLLTGLARQFDGELRFKGQDIHALPTHARQRLGISTMPQEACVFDALPVRGNLTLHHSDASLARYEALFELFPRVRERLPQPAGLLSGGPTEAGEVARRAALGSAFIIAEQNLGFVLSVMSAAIVLDRGDVVLSGSAAELDRPRLEGQLRL